MTSIFITPMVGDMWTSSVWWLVEATTCLNNSILEYTTRLAQIVIFLTGENRQIFISPCVACHSLRDFLEQRKCLLCICNAACVKRRLIRASWFNWQNDKIWKHLNKFFYPFSILFKLPTSIKHLIMLLFAF